MAILKQNILIKKEQMCQEPKANSTTFLTFKNAITKQTNNFIA